MNARPLLTIAIPFYRNVEYLRRAVASVLSQPGNEWVAMLVDNSVDEAEHAGALELVAPLARDRLQYVKASQHLSANDNFNRCIELAETDLVSFVHGDDEVAPCYAQQLLGLADRHPEAAVLFLAAAIIDDKSRPRFSFVDWVKVFLRPIGRGDIVLHGEGSLQSIARGDWINGAAICYRKSIMGNLRWDSRYPMASDLDLWSRVLLSGRVMAGTRKPPAYLYRRHRAQTTESLKSNLARFWEEAAVLEAIAERARAAGWRDAERAARSKTTLQLHLAYLAAGDLATGKISRAREKALVLRTIRNGALRE